MLVIAKSDMSASSRNIELSLSDWQNAQILFKKVKLNLKFMIFIPFHIKENRLLRICAHLEYKKGLIQNVYQLLH